MQMQSHYRTSLHRRDEQYEQEDYDEYEYEEEGSEEEEEEEREEPVNSKEQQEFLSLREQLKEKFRKKLKKQTASAFGRQSLVNKKTPTNDKFGSFFGPSQPVIASRVLDERRSIQETNHVVPRIPSSSSQNAKVPVSTTSQKKAHIQYQPAKVINEVKKKAQTLKDMRDYSFLLSDDADFPASDMERQCQPAARKPVPISDGRRAQASLKDKPKPPLGKPLRPVPNGHESKNTVAKNLQSQTRVGPVKGDVSRPRPASAEHRRVVGVTGNNGSGKTIVNKPLPSKVPAMPTGASRPLAKVTIDSSSKRKLPSAAPHPSSQKNHYSVQKRPSERLDKVRTAPKQPLPSSKPQMKPAQKIPVRDSREGQLKKKPVKRRFDEEDDEDAIQMIRNMFGYNPNRYVGADEDDSDMEADFRQIQKEERRSSKIAKEEDEEQLRLIEEEERRERMRKKQKLSQR